MDICAWRRDTYALRARYTIDILLCVAIGTLHSDVYLAVFPSFKKEGKPEGKGGFRDISSFFENRLSSRELHPPSGLFLFKKRKTHPVLPRDRRERSTPEKEWLLGVPLKIGFR